MTGRVKQQRVVTWETVVQEEERLDDAPRHVERRVERLQRPTRALQTNVKSHD